MRRRKKLIKFIERERYSVCGKFVWHKSSKITDRTSDIVYDGIQGIVEAFMMNVAGHIYNNIKGRNYMDTGIRDFDEI
jgi:hypothetical protein